MSNTTPTEAAPLTPDSNKHDSVLNGVFYSTHKATCVLYGMTADDIGYDHLKAVNSLVFHLEEKDKALDADNARADSLGAWKCQNCGARFEQSVSAVELEGVELCSSCVEVRELRTALEQSQAECGQLKEQLPLLTAKERLEEGGMARRFESTFGYPPTKEDLERIIAQTDAELEAQKEQG